MNVREWHPEDTATLLNWVDEDPKMIEDLGLAEGATKNDVFDMANRLLFEPNALVLAVDGEDGLLGFIAVTNVQRDGSSIGIVGVSPHHRGKGGLVMRSALKVAFNDLGLQSVISTVNKGRERLAKLHKALGFTDPPKDIFVLTRQDWEKSNG